MSAQAAIHPERDAYKPGEEVRGTLEVLEPTDAQQLTLTLEYRDWTDDYAAIGRAVSPAAVLHEGGLERGASYSFAISLPAGALPNQEGKFGSASWGLHACIARAGKDAHVWQPITVSVPAP